MARRGESIYKRKDGRWEARYVKYLEFDGKKHIASVYGKTYMEVKVKREAVLRNSSLWCVQRDDRSITLNSLLYQWLDWNRNQIKLSSYQKYEGLIRNHIYDSIGKTKVIHLSRMFLLQYANYQLDHGNVINHGSLSPKTVNSILTLIGSALSWYGETLYHIQIPSVKEAVSLSQTFNPLELLAIEEYCKNNANGYTLAIMLALHTGMRIGEICALDWSDVKDDRIRVRKTMHRLRCDDGRWRVLISEPKTHNACRDIPISSQLHSFLQRYHKSDGYVLQQDSGSFIEPRLLQKNFAMIMNQLELPKRTFHSLRHTFATRLIECGSDPKTVSELLGHSNVQITLNRYVHPSFQLKRNAVETLAFCGQKDGQANKLSL